MKMDLFSFSLSLVLLTFFNRNGMGECVLRYIFGFLNDMFLFLFLFDNYIQ